MDLLEVAEIIGIHEEPEELTDILRLTFAQSNAADPFPDLGKASLAYVSARLSRELYESRGYTPREREIIQRVFDQIRREAK